MIDPNQVPPVDPAEPLAQFVLYGKFVRKSDQTVRAEAFIPHPYDELSLTRHRDATEIELWEVGARVAAQQKKNLHGRADVLTTTFIQQGLRVIADPIPDEPDVPGNPNHANVIDWPPDDYNQQRLLAVEIAKGAILKAKP